MIKLPFRPRLDRVSPPGSRRPSKDLCGQVARSNRLCWYSAAYRTIEQTLWPSDILYMPGEDSIRTALRVKP